MAPTVWCVSSRAVASVVDVTIDADASGLTASLGGLYLLHPTIALSLLGQFGLAMTAAGVAAPEAYITEAGYVRLTSSGVFAVTWTSTTLRDLLGFTGDLSGADAYTATNRSTLLWSPGKTETPELAPLGCVGQRVLDLSVAYGTEGRQSVRIEGNPTVRNRFSWAHVPKARYLAASTYTAGEFCHFWLNELIGGQRWILLRGVSEGASTTVSASYGSATALGPYKADLADTGFRSTPFARSSGFERVEAYYDITIPAVQTTEFA